MDVVSYELCTNCNASRPYDQDLVSIKMQETFCEFESQEFLITKGNNHFSVTLKFLLRGFLNAGPYYIPSESENVSTVLVQEKLCNQFGKFYSITLLML